MEEVGGERRCENCGELSPARAKFCLECGTRFPAGAPEGAPADDLVDSLPQATGHEGERRFVSVLFADLSGFTAYSEGSDVEDVRTVAQEMAERLGQIVERYGGTVDKIIGDNVMAVFGAPAAHEDDPERAVRTALDMQHCVTDNRDRFAGLMLTVGVNTGEAMWSPIGPDGRYTVLGDTVNTAARLQSAAARGTVVIGESTYHAVGDAIECEQLEPIKAKNKAEPVPAWLAVAVKGERRAHKPVRASLVGREQEMTRLWELWEHVRTDHRPYGAVVLGAAGMGKSRLVEAITDRVADSAIVLRGRCLPFGEGITYWPLIEIIQQAAGIHHDDAEDVVSAKLGALLESLGSEDLDELRTIAVAMANLIGAPATPRGTYTATQISRGELHWGLRRILEHLGAGDRPLVLVLEDLHWAEPTLLELIDYIFQSGEQAAILGIATARPELKENGEAVLAQRPNRRVLELGALADENAGRIVAELFGSDDLPEGPLADLLHSAGGNPLFLEEMVQMWRESGVASEDPQAALNAVAIPSGLQALIDSRLDRLPSSERSLVSRAAVIGDVFWTGALSALIGGNGDIDVILEALEARDLVRVQATSTISEEREYAFKNGLIRDVAYARLTKAERASLHERCGNWIGGLPGGEQEFAEIIAYHLDQACRLASEVTRAAPAPTLAAVRALGLAADKAEAREGMREGSGFLERAIALLGEGFPETAIELRLQRSRMLAGLGDLELAYEEMTRAAADAAAADRPDLRCRAVLSMAEGDILLGRASQGRAYLEEADELARRIDDPILRIRAAWLGATLQQRFDGNPDGAVEQLRSAVALAEEVGDSASMLNGHMRLGALHYNVGRLPEASAEFERSIDIAREQGSLRHQSWLTAFLGLIRYHCGPREEADDLYAHASVWMERTNDLYMRVQTLVWRAALALRMDDVKSALRLLREAMPPAREVGGSLVADAARYLAEGLSMQARAAEAREVAAEARARSPEEDPFAQACVLVAEAFAAVAAHDAGTVRERFDGALPILVRRGGKIEIGETHLAYARALKRLGDIQGTTDQLVCARDVFESMSALATVAEIDGELERLRESGLERTEAAT